MLNRITCFIFTFFSLVYSFGLEIDTSLQKQALCIQTKYFISKAPLTIDSANAVLKDKSCKKFTSESPNLGLIYAGVWSKIELTNTTKSIKTYYLEVASPRFDTLKFYIKEEDKYVLKHEFGDAYDFSSKPVKHRNGVIELSFEPGESKEIILFASKEGDTYFPLYLWDKQGHADATYIENFRFGIIFGLLFLLFILSFILVLIYRKSHFIYYASYVFFMFFALMGNYGFSHQFLFQNNAFLNNQGYAILAQVVVVCFFLFVGDYLAMRSKSSKVRSFILYKICVYPVITITVFYACFFWESTVIEYGFVMMKTTLLLFMIGYITIFCEAIIQSFQKKKEAILFLISFMFLILGLGIHTLTVSKILPYNFITQYALLLGSLSEIVFLTFALGYNALLQQKQNVQLLEKLNLKQKEVTEAIIKGENLERKRIAADIHDEIGSSLTHFKLVLEKDQAPNAHIQLVDALHSKAKTILYKISPFENTSFVLNVQELVQKLNIVSKEEIHLSMVGDFDSIDKVLAYTIVRVIQEGINNALKYANSTMISINLSSDPNELILIIEDNGIGFDLQKVEKGLGLFNMETRINQLQGDFSIETSLGNGTVLIANFKK